MATPQPGILHAPNPTYALVVLFIQPLKLINHRTESMLVMGTSGLQGIIALMLPLGQESRRKDQSRSDEGSSDRDLLRVWQRHRPCREDELKGKRSGLCRL